MHQPHPAILVLPFLPHDFFPLVVFLLFTPTFFSQPFAFGRLKPGPPSDHAEKQREHHVREPASSGTTIRPQPRPIRPELTGGSLP
ncbi:hypothetical protein B0H14DRAFT_2931720 [Mycena olivaceomarginata]|nr:hypothetical protein B0H14DRAFT_2931720 [Mycena olivaceomarginata]